MLHPGFNVSPFLLLPSRHAEGWDKRWKQSDWKKSSGEAGEWKWSAGDWYGDEEADKGVMTSPDARFHTLYGAMDAEFENKVRT